MSYKILFYDSFDKMISKVIEDYINIIENKKEGIQNISNNPIIITQTQGISKYLYYKFIEKRSVLLNIKTFNLQSLFNEYSKFFLNPELKLENKNIVFWYLYSFFYDKAKEEEIEQTEKFDNFVVFLYKFSDLYEQYETYRNFDEWEILQWQDLNSVNTDYFSNLGELIEEGKIYQNQFQIELIKLIINSNFENIKFNIGKRLKDKNFKSNFPSNPLFIIGFDNIPYFYIDFLKTISKFVDINFYFWVPLSILNKNEKNTHSEEKTSLLLKFCFDNQKEFINDFLKYFTYTNNNIIEKLNFKSRKNEAKSDDKTLLNVYQNFIKGNDLSNINLVDDNSIEILINYTKLREIETVKDKICYILSKDQSLNYEDIFVMAPDISKYQPFIENVFDLQSPSLPYMLVDKDNFKNSDIFNLLNLLFEVLRSNFSKKDFLNFISNEMIMKKFEIDYEDIDSFSDLFSDYVWGVDYEDITNYYKQIKGSYYINKSNSFQFDIESNFLTYYIGYLSSNSYYDNNVYNKYKDKIINLNSEIEGEFLTIIEKIYSIYLNILYFYKFAKSTHNIEEYRNFFENLLSTFFIDIQEYHDEIIYYRNKIINFLNDIELGYNNFEQNFGKKDIQIPFNRLVDLLILYLKSYPYSYGYTKGKILFSNLITLRNIPARVIVILGLSDDNYPRSSINLSYDLLVNKKKSWDRDLRESDKYLFLQTILSAKDFLILSYVGKDPISNKDISPSILITMLEQDINLISDILKKEIKLEKNLMPLQPFSKKYFDEENYKFVTFNKGWENLLEKIFKDNSDKFIDSKDFKAEIIDQTNTIDFEDLVEFIISPVEHYLKKVLNIQKYINNQKVESEFDKYVSKIKYQRYFIELLKLILKKRRNNYPLFEEHSDCLKIKYLNHRGSLAEIESQLFQSDVTSFINVIDENLVNRANSLNFDIDQLEIKEETRIIPIEKLDLKLKIKYWLILENETEKAIIYYSKNSKDSKKNPNDKIKNYLYKCLLGKFYQLEDFDIKREAITETYKNLKLLKINGKSENIKEESQDCLLLDILEIYKLMIFFKNFIPIFEIDYNKESYLEFGRINLDKIVAHWENSIFVSDYNYSENFNIFSYFKKWIFDRAIKNNMFKENYENIEKFEKKIIELYDLSNKKGKKNGESE